VRTKDVVPGFVVGDRVISVPCDKVSSIVEQVSLNQSRGHTDIHAISVAGSLIVVNVVMVDVSSVGRLWVSQSIGVDGDSSKCPVIDLTVLHDETMMTGAPDAPHGWVCAIGTDGTIWTSESDPTEGDVILWPQKA